MDGKTRVKTQGCVFSGRQASMRKPVLLSVTGTAQNVGQPDDAVHLITTGYLSGEKDAWRLRYSETQPDSTKGNRVLLSMADGVVTMQREGEYGTSMVFEKGRRFEGVYNTPYGALDMGVYATQVRYQVDGAHGEVMLKYQLDLQGQYAAMHELRICFAERGKQ